MTTKLDVIVMFIRRFTQEQKYAPSMRDIQDGLGISSTSVVSYNLNKLEQAGRIRRDRYVARSIVLTEDTE